MAKIDVFMVGLKKESNEIIVTTSKKALAKFVGVTPITIARHLTVAEKHESKSYITWSNVVPVRHPIRNKFPVGFKKM